MTKSPKKILIADDEIEITDSLKRSLEESGYQVLTACDGLAAVELARREMPDLILLDIMLPTLDGYRVLKILKSDERYQGIPILVITARAGMDDWALAVECGANGCLNKPVRVSELMERIDACFKQTTTIKNNAAAH